LDPHGIGALDMMTQDDLACKVLMLKLTYGVLFVPLVRTNTKTNQKKLFPCSKSKHKQFSLDILQFFNLNDGSSDVRTP